MNAIPKVLISVNVGEYNPPVKDGQEDGLQRAYRGVLRTLELFDQYKIRATFFISAAWARKYPGTVRQLSLRHEVGAYGDYATGALLMEITGGRIYGLRMPCKEPVNYTAFKSAGFLYDAAVGKENHPRTMYLLGGNFVIPTSVSPLLRYSFSNIAVTPVPIQRHLAKVVLKKDRLLAGAFTANELADQVPVFPAGVQTRANARLVSFLQLLKQEGSCCTYVEWLQEQLTD